MCVEKGVMNFLLSPFAALELCVHLRLKAVSVYFIFRFGRFYLSVTVGTYHGIISWTFKKET